MKLLVMDLSNFVPNNRGRIQDKLNLADTNQTLKKRK